MPVPVEPPLDPEERGARASWREILSWCLFDFANSGYTTLIVTVAYSVYFVKTVVGEGGVAAGDGDFLWGLGNFLSQGIVVLTAPVLGAVADFSAWKKRLLLVSYLGCVLTTAVLGIVGPGDVILGLTLFIVSNVFYSTGENLIAAFLPELVPPERMGRVSGLGWGLGYLGGLLCLVLCRPFMEGGFGPDNAASVQTLFVVVAAFFALSGLPTLLFLKERAVRRQPPAGKSYLAVGFSRVASTLRQARRYRQLFRFLVVFFLYNCGINIVVSFSAIYAVEEVGMAAKEVPAFFIVVQVSAAIGAVAFGLLQDRVGARRTIWVTLALWLIVCGGAYLTHSPRTFHVLGNVAGLAMGSSMSAGRALVGTFAPAGRAAEFFGFWGLWWKLSAAIGPLTFGGLTLVAGRRSAILLTGFFFLAGAVGLFFVDEREGRRQAAAPDD